MALDEGSASALGGAKDNDELRKRRFEDLPNQNRFFEMKQQRDAQRLEYIRLGVLPDPDKAQDLSAAKSLTGTCMEMCPEFERVEREFQNEGDALEMYPGSNCIDPELAVKIYRRPAAGRELPLPEDVRPPIVLRQTLDYLFHRLLPSDPASAQFTVVQPFMWNRTRAIRQDFIVQGLRGQLEIECHERIARYHILCLHWKGGVGAEGWSEQQELEQLRKTIRSLTEFYEDLRKSTGESSPNEAEFRAYNLLLHMQDPETLREVEILPSEVFDSPGIQAALRLRGYAQRSNNVIRRGRPLNTESTMNLWTRFFGEIKNSKDVSYLLACLAENAFSQVRAGAIKAMGKTYLSQHTPLSLEYLRRSLGMDTEEEARLFAAALNCEEVRAGGPDAPVTAMRLARANEDKPLPIAPFSKTIVEMKRGQHTSQDIVDGKLSRSAPLIPIHEAKAKQGTSKRDLNRATKLSTSNIASTNHATLPSSSTFSIPTLAAPTPGVKRESSPFTFTTTSFSAPSFGSSLSATAPVFTPSTFTIPEKPLESTTVTLTTSFAAPSPTPKQPSFPTRTSFAFQEIQSPSTNLASEPNIPSTSSFTAPASTSFISTKEPSSKPFSASIPIASSKSVTPNATTSPANESPASSHKIRREDQLKAPTIQKTVTPTRTITSVTSSLTTSLIKEFLDYKLNSISQQACLREMRVRRKSSREQIVSDVVQDLLQSLEVELIDDTVITIASETIADEFRIRCLENLVLQGRRRAVERAVERRRQQERLRKVRSELEGRGLSVHKINGHDHKSDSQRVPIHLTTSAVEDRDLQDKLRKAKEQRQNLWTPVTFFRFIRDSLHKSAPTDLHTWTVSLSLCQDAEATSQWLRRKMGVEEEPLYEDSYRDDVTLRVLDLGKQPLDMLQKERDVGLILFEISPLLKYDNKALDEWRKSRQRLQRLSQQSFTTQGRFHPKLLLISWSPVSTLQEEETMRKIIFKELELGATDSQRYYWSQIEICYLGSELSTPQANFDKSISRILKTFPRNQQDLRLNLDATSTMCKASWILLLEHVQTTASGSMESSELVNNKHLMLQIFKAVTLLANKALKDLVSISDTLLDVPDDRGYPQLPLMPLNEEVKDSLISQNLNTHDLLLELATLQLQECHENSGDERILLLQSWLLEESRTSFPWISYFERLYQWHLTLLEDTWLECKMPLDREGKLQINTTSALCQSAWKEIEQKMRDATLIRSYPTIKKRSVDETNTRSNHTVKKSRRIDSLSNQIQNTTTSSLSSSHEVNSLRALMASASQLLYQS